MSRSQVHIRPVSVQPSSLYISTVALVTGAFHWSFIHVDDTGRATKHQWAAVNAMNPEGREHYVQSNLRYGTQSSTGNLAILGYFKIPEYRPMDGAIFAQYCVQAFGGANYPTKDQNRAHGITCRTFVLNVLRSILPTSGPEAQVYRISQIEAMVKNRSEYQSNAHSTLFLWGKHSEMMPLLEVV